MPGNLERNCRLYPWYAAALNAHFWLPVFFLYFSSQFTLPQVLRLEAVYYAAIVVFEVPSGYFSDAAGRRRTLLVATTSLVTAYCLFFIGASYDSFILAQIALAVGLAFNSGTDTSLHYESLSQLGKEDEFDNREAKAAQYSFIAAALAAVLGGASAVVDLRYAYALSAIAAVVALSVVVAMREPQKHDETTLSAAGFVRQLVSCVVFLRRPALCWLFLYFVIMVVLNHVPYEFYQPYIELQNAAWKLPADSVPAISGIMTAIPMMLAGLVAWKSIWVRNRIGLVRTLLLAGLLQCTIILTMGLVLHPVVLFLIMLRSCPRGLMTAPINAAVAPQIPSALRATFFSLQSFAGRLSFSGLLLLLSLVVGEGDDARSEGVFVSLRIAAAVGIGGVLLLGLTARALQTHRGIHR